MKSMLCLILLSLAAVSGAVAADAPWPPRGYACARTLSPVTVDGRLDDAAWVAAPWTDFFVDIEGDARPRPRYRTRAKMLWDDRFLYVAAEMEEPNLWATLRERDSIIFHDNDFEVFLDPDGDSHLYTEIELNALNTVWDLLLVKPYRDGGPALHAWDIPGLQSAVHLEGTLNDPGDADRGWSVEIAIPFAVIAETTRAACPPHVGDRWRLNFSRVEWRLDVKDGGYAKTLAPATGKPLPEDNWVWSPQRKIAMHEPEYWGIVQFVEKATGPVLPAGRDRAAWTLRQISYRLVDEHRRTGRYPATIESEPGIRYWSDGSRYTLTTEVDRITLTLDETGLLTTAGPE